VVRARVPARVRSARPPRRFDWRIGRAREGSCLENSGRRDERRAGSNPASSASPLWSNGHDSALRRRRCRFDSCWGHLVARGTRRRAGDPCKIIVEGSTPSCSTVLRFGACSSAARASRSHRGDPRFESWYAHRLSRLERAGPRGQPGLITPDRLVRHQDARPLLRCGPESSVSPKSLGLVPSHLVSRP
jgi:hypothetical protein